MTLAYATLSLSGCDSVGEHFKIKYYEDTYSIIEIPSDIDTTKFPKRLALEDLKVINAEAPFHKLAGLKALGRQAGVDSSLNFVNWTTGFTFGAYMISGDPSSILFYSDLELGTQQFAGYVGRIRNFYYGKKEAEFKQFIKQKLTEGTAPRLTINYGKKNPESVTNTPPLEVLVIGYDDKNVFFFGASEPQETGDTLQLKSEEWSKFSLALRNHCQNVGYPWLYYCTTFEGKEQPNQDISSYCRRNGSLLEGGQSGPVFTGARAIKGLSDWFYKNNKIGPELANYIGDKLDQGRESRLHTSRYLKVVFKDQPAIIKAANHLEESATCLAKAKLLLPELKEKQNEVVGWLDKAAEHEKKAGKEMINF